MDDPIAAQELVESIRGALGIEEGGHVSQVAKIAENSLRMLSEELYSKPAHFLLELIQNADDNTYDMNTIPKLSIVYRTDGYLWLGCNERGFSEANLRALCTVKESTKKVENNQKGYIGEKGIGFKSVFKVADVVWIKSRALSFRFDKNEPLGMVAPIWSEFPANAAIQEQTMFCFKIPDATNQEVVRRDVTALGAELLLFLRQLRSIDIALQTPEGAVIESHRRERHDQSTSQFRVTELLTTPHDSKAKSSSERFVVYQHTATRMPFHEKRQGIVESDLLLAFPVDEDFMPVLRSRQVYNFLPIRSYGFPFVLQADFVLPSTREDIYHDTPWNKSLVAATQEMFVECVKAFNEHGILKFSWVQFLRSRSNLQGTVFDGWYEALLQHLRQHRVVNSELLTLERPGDLRYVRKAFTDDDSKPLLSGATGPAGFVHHEYELKDLAVLGIQQQSSDEFYTLLAGLIKKNRDDFRNKSLIWHSRLAGAIIAAGAERARGLNMIPLRSGFWVCAKGKKLFFPELAEGVSVPKGIEVDIINDEAARDESRRELYLALGASRLDEARVFDLILQQHGRRTQSQAHWPVEDVVQHAWFVFRARSFPREFDLKRLQVASRDGNLRSGKDVYMDLPDATIPLSKFLEKCRSKVHYLHDSYFDKPSLQAVDNPNGSEILRKKWLKWLQEAIGVRTVPRLCIADGISPEFDSIMTSSQSNEWLQLLKDEWDHYATDLRVASNVKVKDLLINTDVLCLDGQRRPLKDVYLPTQRVLKEPLARANVPMLVINDPDSEGWRTCGNTLKMRIIPDAELYLKILTRMQEDTFGFLVDDVKRMYSELARNCHGLEPRVKREFQSKPLVYIASPRPGKWVALGSCRWKSPAAICTLYALSERYRQCAELFQHRLHLQDATAQDVVGELTNLNGHVDRIKDIEHLIQLLASYVQEGKIDINSFPGLMYEHIKILPVRLGDDNVALKAFFGEDWFIADGDSPFLAKQFHGKVFIVDPELLARPGVRKLFEKLGLLRRLLSERKETHVQIPEEGFLLEAETEMMRPKAEYMARIAEVARREQCFRLMSNCQVSVADAIVRKTYLNVKGKMVYGNDETTSSALQPRASSLQVWVSTEEFEDGKLPYHEFLSDMAEKLWIPTRHINLLMTIRTNDDRVRIERKLEAAGFGRRVDVAGFASGSSAATNGARPAVIDLTRGSRNGHDVRVGSVRGAGNGTGGIQYRSPRPFNDTAQRANGVVETRLWKGSGHSAWYSNGSARVDRRSREGTPRPRAPIWLDDGETSVHQGTGINIDTSGLDLSQMHATLRKAISEDNNSASAASLAQLTTNVETAATKAELAIGAAGEKFVYEMLKQEVGIDYDSWTSAARSGYGFEPFSGDEAAFTDFTITDPLISARFCIWLAQKADLAAASAWINEPKNFHIEVKTTNGAWNEPFEFSNNQLRLANQFHHSARDEMVVFRVYHVGSKPGLHVWHDVPQLKKELVLTVESKTGFYIWPS